MRVTAFLVLKPAMEWGARSGQRFCYAARLSGIPHRNLWGIPPEQVMEAGVLGEVSGNIPCPALQTPYANYFSLEYAFVVLKACSLGQSLGSLTRELHTLMSQSFKVRNFLYRRAILFGIGEHCVSIYSGNG